MKQFRKRMLSNSLVMALVLSSLTSTISINALENDKEMFNDTKGHWGESIIGEFAKHGYIKGYGDNLFKPNSTITRAEFIKIINSVFEFIDKEDEKFSDVNKSDWFYHEVQKAVKAGYIDGYKENSTYKFKPNDKISREEACKIVSVVLKHNDNGRTKFKDDKQIQEWAIKYVKGLTDIGIINGFEDNTFRPKEYITRAESVKIIHEAKIKYTKKLNIPSGNKHNNSNSSNTEKPPITQGNSIINEERSKLVDVEGTGYAVVYLEKGDINSSEFNLNGNKINPKSVNTEGTIVKFEVNPKEVINIKIIQKKESKNITDNITLNKNGEKFTKLINNESPSKVLVSGPISVFDYHKTNYDENGNVRINPQKTTFNLKSKDYTNNNVPKLTSQKSKLGEDIVINYDVNHKNSKDWKESIYSVEKVYLDNKKTEKLRYSLEDGKIVIKSESTAINGRNGEHIIKVKSKGYDDIKTKIEIVKDAGQINLSPNYNYIAHSDLLFELENFDYAVQNPIYEVLLDGQKLMGDCKEYHIVSNLITLENDCKSKLTPGQHTITVKAHGYEDFTRTFYLEDTNNKKQILKLNKNVKKLDAVATASMGGGSSEGGSAGGKVMRANLVYDFDLLSNAMILEKIGEETKESKAVLSWWSQMTKDAILTPESNKVIDYKNYKNSLNEAKINGKYITFKEYYDSKKESDYKNAPYNIKYVLEDGLLGEIQPYSQENLKLTSKSYVEKVDNNIIITFDGESKEYISNISKISIGDYNLISKDKYDIVDNKIIIKDTTNFESGINKIKITANGYKDNTLELEMFKENSQIQLKRDINENIIISLDKDFKQKVKGISLNGKNLLSDTQSGANSGDYYYNEDEIVLKSKLFENIDSQYTAIITSQGYKDVIETFIPSKLEKGEAKLKKVPSYVILNKDNTYKVSSKIIIDVEDVFNGDYRKNIKEVNVNGKKVDFKNCKDKLYSIEIDGENFNQVGSYDIVLKSNSYEAFNTNIQVQNDESSSNEETPLLENKVNIDYNSFSKKYSFNSIDYSWRDNIISVTINNVEVKKATQYFANDGYRNNYSNGIEILSELKNSDEVVIKSNGYTDYKTTIN
ncbi:hemoblobin-interacting domain-containing protein [Romboutsia lituseburensis]|uniref:hemoblobin-interacting domain-containing protein n=1 Tax=Romboutsia lituseburensis TaxID=1537 RepID=UPI00215AE200|nr:hemoblobin-interacting domain-containing protein [Romboutsia lituseburensis]MCR8746930.1 DUF1533 domain-containing protein [Romboutsia lituseburensis]